MNGYHYRDVTLWYLKSLANVLFVHKHVEANNKEYSTVPITGLMWRESTSDQWIPLTTDQWCRKYFHGKTSSCNLNSRHLHMDQIPPYVEPNIAITVATDVLAPNNVMPSASTVLSTKLDILVGLQKCSCLVTWFCYQMIAKPGNKTAALSWPNPYMIQSYYQWLWVMFSWADNIIQNTCQNFIRYGDTSSI